MFFTILAQAPSAHPSHSLLVQATPTLRTTMAKAMKAMKAMKAAKAMKAMKNKVASKIGKGRYAKAMVFRKSKEKTYTGLKASDLGKSKSGKIVSKKKSAFAKKSPWIAAVKKARAALKIKGFSLIKKGSPLYIKAKEFYNQ